MAVSLFPNDISDICLGKPTLRSLPLSTTTTVADALSALKTSRETSLSLWTCDDHADDCVCVGKISVADIVCFLAREENLPDPAAALQAPAVSAIVPKAAGIVRHLEPKSSLVDAIDVMLDGAQNVVIPTAATASSRRKRRIQLPLTTHHHHHHHEYCWLTQEDVVRYLLTSITRFSPTASYPINNLQLIDKESILAVHYDDSASSALPLIAQSILTQTSVAVLDHSGKLVGEISPLTLSLSDETVSPAIATLSVGDLMAYFDCCGGPPAELVQLVKERLQERNLESAMELMEDDCGIWSSSSCSSASSDEEFGVVRSGRSGGQYSRLSRSSEMAVCHPWSSLVAIMIQALSRRVMYVWVVEDDGSLAGIVTFIGMLKVFRERLRSVNVI